MLLTTVQDRHILKLFCTALALFAFLTVEARHEPPRWNYSLSLVAPQPYFTASGFPELSRANFKRRPGLGFGAQVHAAAGRRLHAMAGLQVVYNPLVVLSYGRLFRYHAVGLSGPIYVQFDFVKRKWVSHGIQIGVRTMAYLNGGDHHSLAPDRDYPLRTITITQRSGIYPMPAAGYAVSWTTAKGRRQQCSFVFWKGYRPIVEFEIERHGPQGLSGSLEFRGSGLMLAYHVMLRRVEVSN